LLANCRSFENFGKNIVYEIVIAAFSREWMKSVDQKFSDDTELFDTIEGNHWKRATAWNIVVTSSGFTVLSAKVQAVVNLLPRNLHG
jgi:hypothetical protein